MSQCHVSPTTTVQLCESRPMVAILLRFYSIIRNKLKSLKVAKLKHENLVVCSKDGGEGCDKVGAI